MSPPVLIDNGAPINLHGQVSHSPLSLNFAVNSPTLFEKPQVSLSRAMNSSDFGHGNSEFFNSSDFNSGFSNSSQNNANFSFNSSSISRSSNKGISMPRMVKMRKQSNSLNSKSASATRVGPGFNPFRPELGRADYVSSVSNGEFDVGSGGNEAFVFGDRKSDLGGKPSAGVWNVEKKVLEDMRNMGIGSGNASKKGGFVFGVDRGVDLVIDENMEKLSIDDREERVRNEIVDNVSSFVERSAKSVLLNEFEKKLSSEGKGDFDGRSGCFNADGMKKFGTKSGGRAFVESLENILPDQIKNLNIKDSVGTATIVNDSGGYSFAESSGDALPDQIKNLNIKESVDAATVNESGGYALAESSGDALPDHIKNLNIKDSVGATTVNNNIDEKNIFALGNRDGVRGYMDGEKESILLNEMASKLNIGSAESSGQTDSGFSTSQTWANRTGNMGDKRFPNFGNTSSNEFVFEGGMQGANASGSQVPTDQPKVDPQPSGVAGTSFVFSFSGLSGGNASGVPLTHGQEKVDSFRFTSKQDSFSSPFVEFKTPNSKGNICSGLDQKLIKGSKAKKKRGKLKQPTKVHLWPGQDHVLREGVSQEIPEAFESYSPMDVSPYPETVSDAHLSRETSVASGGSFGLDNNHASTDSQADVLNDTIDEDLVVATEQMDINGEHSSYDNINEENVKSREAEDDGSGFYFEKVIGAERPLEDSISVVETESFKSANEEIDFINDNVDTSAENDASSSTKVERQDSDVGTQYGSPVSSEDIGFTFAASFAAQSSSKRNHKKKNSAKLGYDSYDCNLNAKVPYSSSALQFTPFSGSSLPLSPARGKKVGLSTPLHTAGNSSEVLRRQDTKQDPDLVSATSIASQEACEKWRLRGNQAYRSGDLSKAEDLYTQGVNCIAKGETSRSCLRALMLCYSNRAATRMSLGRMRDALEDCQMAVAIDPNFLRVQVRAATCHLSLGEVEEASQYLKRCLQLGSDVCVDRKIAIEASEGLQKAQKVSECMQHAVDLLQRRTSTDAGDALQAIAEALCISPYSEKLLQMKAESLFMLRKYKDVIQLCEQTFNSAKRNSPLLNADCELMNAHGSEFQKESSFRLWRCCLIFKSYFYLGRLEEAFGSLEKQDELDTFAKSKIQELLMPLSTTVQELVHHKAAGNEAFQAGRHSEAIEHYTVALSRNVESRPFAAICFCNRAAAYKSLGQIVDAIADCSLAIALDGSYLKAISRRATLYEMIRDYGQATTDLQRLVAALTRQVEEKTNQHGASDGSTNLSNDLRQARLRLSSVEDEARKEVPLDMYLILGVEPSASASEIKKAYRKAALRHHPDKAGQSLARSDNGDDGLWKDIGEEVHKDADRLFKMIGQAYQELSDPTKRSKYDLEEEMRTAQKKRNESSSYRMHADSPNHPFERSGRRHWREVWRSYGS